MAMTDTVYTPTHRKIFIYAEDLLGTLSHGEAFGNGGVRHGVDAGLRVL